MAIIRALSIKPQVILFDEPTSALDPVMTNEVVRQIHTMARNGMTVVLATHDLNFAKQASDRVVYIEDREIIEVGTPDQIFHFQKSERTKRFVLSSKTV